MASITEGRMERAVKATDSAATFMIQKFRKQVTIRDKGYTIAVNEGLGIGRNEGGFEAVNFKLARFRWLKGKKETRLLKVCGFGFHFGMEHK